jgi:hypothetical protein
LCHFADWSQPLDLPLNLWDSLGVVDQPIQMFSATLTDSRSFGNTYQWAILSVLPMDSDKNQHGLNSPEIKKELGLSNAARTSLCLMLKEMAAKGLVQRYDYKVGNRRFVTYKRLMPLRKRERIAQFLGL